MTRHTMMAGLLACAALVGCDEPGKPPPLIVAISSPTTDSAYDTNQPSVVLQGSATGGERVTRVTWINAATLGGGTAAGTQSWSATIPLTAGDNPITVTGHDSNGNDGTGSITINYQPGFHLAPQSISFETASGLPPPAAGAADLTFNGGGVTAWTAASDSPWIRVTPASGTITAADTVSLGISVVASETDSWLGPLSTANAPTPRNGHVAVWTRVSMFVPWGAVDTDFWNYASDIWTGPTSSTGSCPARWRASAVWTGTEVIIWGGQEGVANVSTGYRYNVLANAWTPISAAGAPSARRGHTAVWTGTEMIVWGGADGAVFWNDGGRYSPLTDTWGVPPTTSGAPTSRGGHGAVWTGTEMIVWGGGDAGGDVVTGARYKPSTDAWTGATTTTGAPAARDAFATAWTGSEMIVWGGHDGTGYLSSGARYDPAADLWRGATTTLGAPTARDGATAVWAGSELILFGGHDGSSPLNDGARYRPPVSLTPGTYTGTVTVADPTSSFVPRAVRVTLVVEP